MGRHRKTQLARQEIWWRRLRAALYRLQGKAASSRRMEGFSARTAATFERIVGKKISLGARPVHDVRPDRESPEGAGLEGDDQPAVLSAVSRRHYHGRSITLGIFKGGREALPQ